MRFAVIMGLILSAAAVATAADDDAFFWPIIEALSSNDSAEQFRALIRITRSVMSTVAFGQLTPVRPAIHRPTLVG
jgi:hypothetical protein